MMKRILERHEWAVDLAAAVLCASALAHATSAALERRASPAPPAMLIVAPRDQYGVQKIGEHSYEIDRGAAAEVVGNMAVLTRSARIVPELHDGEATGFRLYSVRADGPLAALGFRNGDVISAINGRRLLSPEKALEAYATLKSATCVDVAFERNGQSLRNEYRVR